MADEDRHTDNPNRNRMDHWVTLPIHLKWSGRRRYNLADLQDRLLVYEIVLREGTARDVVRYIDVEDLRRHRGRVVLPANVRSAWDAYFESYEQSTGPRREEDPLC